MKRILSYRIYIMLSVFTLAACNSENDGPDMSEQPEIENPGKIWIYSSQTSNAKSLIEQWFKDIKY